MVALVAVYIGGVISQDWIVRTVPKIARIFAPPLFEFSNGYVRGRVSPFSIGMDQESVVNAARTAGLVDEFCHPKIRFSDIKGPPSHCYVYRVFGVKWSLWMRDGRVAAIRVYTSANATSE
jgi:hypothetical protein